MLVRAGPARAAAGGSAVSLKAHLPAAPKLTYNVFTFIIKVNTFMGRRPGRIHDRPFQMRVSAEFLKRLDHWRRRQTDQPSRAEAIRRLVDVALEVNGKRSR